MLAPVLEERWEGRAQSSKHVVRNLHADEVSSESERPKAARRGAAIACQIDEALPAHVRPARRSVDVSKCAPAPPLHHVRPREVNTQVQKLLHRIGNAGGLPVQAYHLGAGPE